VIAAVLKVVAHSFLVAVDVKISRPNRARSRVLQVRLNLG